MRTQPTGNKVKTLGELKTLTEQWRANGETIGITSGVFDILHPGHGSFLRDASERCDRLIVVIASDRTVNGQKQSYQPYVEQDLRAESIAMLAMVDAVIVSDELYHETIHHTIKPDMLFKGSDYEGKDIYGADEVGRVEIIPCKEGYFHRSSQLARRIREKHEAEFPSTWRGNDVY